MYTVQIEVVHLFVDTVNHCHSELTKDRETLSRTEEYFLNFKQLAYLLLKAKPRPALSPAKSLCLHSISE